MKKLCGKMTKKGRMTESRPCIRKRGHNALCTPDLTGLKIGSVKVLSRSKFDIEGRRFLWLVQNERYGWKSRVASSKLTGLRYLGNTAPRGSGLGTKYVNGKNKGIIYLTTEEKKTNEL